MYLHYLWYSSRCVDDSRKNIKDLIYCLTLVVANDVNSNLFDINYMVMVIFQFCYSGMYAPTRILLICEVSVHLMKIYFCETNKKTTCFITTEPVKFKTWRQEDAGTIYRNVSSLNHSYFLCLSSYNLKCHCTTHNLICSHWFENHKSVLQTLSFWNCMF